MRNNGFTEAVLLAGGLGSRLAHTVSNKQKVMAPVNGVPFLSYVLQNLQKAGIQRVILAVGYRREDIMDYYKSRFENMTVIYSVEEAPLGTGGAVKQALDYCNSETVLLLNGDTFFAVDYSALWQSHQDSGADITLSVKPMQNFERYGRVEYDQNNKVVCFHEKQPTQHGVINGGVYAVNKSLLSRMPTGRFSFEEEILQPNQVKEAVFVSDGYFTDIGIAEDYFKAQTELPLALHRHEFKAAFLDRDGVLCKEKHHLYKIEDFEWINGAREALRLLCALGYLTVVVTNQAGIAKGYYTEDDVNRLHEYMKRELTGIAPAPVFYYCPYHPEGRVEAYRRESDCRKPGAGMLFAAVKDFERQGIYINMEKSFMAGDTENDMAAGKNAGVGKTVLVRSGHLIENEENSRADIIADSLYEYVKCLQ